MAAFLTLLEEAAYGKWCPGQLAVASPLAPGHYPLPPLATHRPIGFPDLATR